jgi:hypothetical protein
MPQGEVVGTFDEYAAAVAYVEKLVANDFPVQLIAIVGKNLRSVERGRNRINQGRVALSGAITGSWIGFLFALLMPTGNGTDSAAVASITASTFLQPVLIGAGIGMLFNVLRFTLTKNKRSFVSQSMIIASEYQVQVPSDLVSKAQEAAAKAEVAS